MNPLSWLRKWAESAVLAGVADACDRLAAGGDTGDAAGRLAALTAPAAAELPASDTDAAPRGRGRAGR